MEKEERDLVLVGPTRDDNATPMLRFKADGDVEELIAQPLREGHPVTHGEILELQGDGPVRYSRTIVNLGHKGPARVSTTAFRNGWERVFGSKEEFPN
jgi:hypothetical protein